MNELDAVPTLPKWAARLATAPTLAQVMPSAAASLSHAAGLEAGMENSLGLPQATSACVLLVDGLGSGQLKKFGGHAPFLRGGHHAAGLLAGFPSTTAVSLTSLGTGARPGTHGMLGYEVLDPDRDRVVNLLGSWDPEVVPERWQPLPTVFEKLAAAGVGSFRVGPAKFADTGLSRAAFRGARMVPATSVGNVLSTAVRTMDRNPGSLVYAYWAELDHAGHGHGVGSDPYVRALEELDSALRRAAASLKKGQVLYVTGDHGMMNLPEAGKIDLADRPGLRMGLRHLAGEPRMRHLHAEHGRVGEVLERWRGELGHLAWIATRDQARQAGLFGDLDPRHAPRVGDVVVAFHEPAALFDTDVTGPRPLEMVGHHGSVTEAELRVPLLAFSG